MQPSKSQVVEFQYFYCSIKLCEMIQFVYALEFFSHI